ncbi:MAG: CotH kinase family protein [Eubacteriales bacterium]
MNKIKYFVLITVLIMGMIFSCSDETAVIAEEKPGAAESEAAKIMDVEVISYVDYAKICAENEQTTVNIIENLCLNDIPVPYDSIDNSYYLTIAADDHLNKYKLTHDSREVCIKFVEGLDLNFSLAEAAASGKSYKLFAYDSSSYLLCKIVFTYMPVMTIDNNGIVDDYNYPIASAETDAKMTLTYAGTRQESEIIINIRGGSSRAFPKVSYKMNLVSGSDQNNLNLIGMREDDDWVLLAIYTDESKIRDRLSYDLWSAFGAKNNNYGIHNGAQIKYIELILNGRYWGLYGLVVPVDKKQQNINDKKGEILCKTESWDIPKSSELRRADSAQTVDSIVMNHPKEPNKVSWGIVADFVELIYESDDNVFMDKIADTADIGNVLDYWILVNVISGEDNAWKNMYITFKKDISGYTALVCPWDCDLSWGVTWDGDGALFWQYKEKELTRLIGAGELPNRLILLDVNGARRKLQIRWKALRKGILSDDSLIRQVDMLTDEIKKSGTWDREIKRWPSGGHVLDDNLYIKNFIKGRMKFLDEYIEKINR